MAVTAAVVVEVFTVVGVSVVVASAAVAASTAVGVSAAPAVVDPTAAIAAEDEKARCIEVVATTEACAEIRRRRVIPAHCGPGPGKAVAGLVTPRPAGIRLQDRATERASQGDPAVKAWPVEQAGGVWPQPMPQLPTATGTPSEVSGAATMAGVADFTAAEAMVGAVGAIGAGAGVLGSAGVGIPSGTGRRTITIRGGTVTRRATFTRIRKANQDCDFRCESEQARKESPELTRVTPPFLCVTGALPSLLPSQCELVGLLHYLF